MEFKSALGFDELDESAVFMFEKHEASFACFGDQIWSDGEKVYIYDYVESDVIYELISMVSNKKAFTGAVRRSGLI